MKLIELIRRRFTLFPAWQAPRVLHALLQSIASMLRTQDLRSTAFRYLLQHGVPFPTWGGREFLAPPHAYTVTSNIVILTLSIYDEAVICTRYITASARKPRSGCTLGVLRKGSESTVNVQ